MTTMIKTRVYLILIASILLDRRCLCCNPGTDTFHGACICDISERIADGWSKQVTAPLTSSALNICVLKCARDDNCEGASVESGSNLCYHHYTPPTGTKFDQCVDPGLNHAYVRRSRGTVLSFSHPMNFPCVYWLGEQDPDRKCSDTFTKSRLTAGAVQMAYLEDMGGSGNPLAVMCRMHSDSIGAEISVMRSRGFKKMGSTWNDYKYGFYNDDYHYWIGFDTLHKYTSNAFATLQITLFWKPSADNPPMRYTYNSFFVFGESDGYKITYASAFPDSETSPGGSSMGNCLVGLNDVQFSTPDADNDGNPSENCASKADSGWWFVDPTGCSSKCNLFGWLDYSPMLNRRDEHYMRVDGIPLSWEYPKFDYIHIALWV